MNYLIMQAQLIREDWSKGKIDYWKMISQINALGLKVEMVKEKGQLTFVYSALE